MLEEAGYSSNVSEYDLRLTNTLTLSANALHETRIGYSWQRTLQAPNSSVPNLEVAGYFTGGGATSQNLNDRERDLEVDDDILATRGKHELNFGFHRLTCGIVAGVENRSASTSENIRSVKSIRIVIVNEGGDGLSAYLIVQSNLGFAYLIDGITNFESC